MELSNIPNTGFFNRIASLINENFDKIRQRFLEVGDASANANAAAVSAAQAAQSLATIQNEIASLDPSQSTEAAIAALDAKIAVNKAAIEQNTEDVKSVVGGYVTETSSRASSAGGSRDVSSVPIEIIAGDILAVSIDAVTGFTSPTISLLYDSTTGTVIDSNLTLDSFPYSFVASRSADNITVYFHGSDVAEREFTASVSRSRPVNGWVINDSYADFDISDNSGNVIARFEGGHIKTKNFDSSHRDIDEMIKDSSVAFDIADENKYVIARFSDGHIKTKEFDSRESLLQSDLISESPMSDFDIADEEGYVVARFRNGHIRTKNFDSSNIEAIDYVRSKYEGKRVSILGDSISTFGTPSSTNQLGTYCYSYYPTATCRYSVDGVDSIQFNVNNTWWMRLIDRLGASLGINESWRGTLVTGNGASTFNNQTRINHLGENGTPDLILVYGGTNDAGNSAPLGTFDGGVYSDYDTSAKIAALDVSTFANAYKAMLIRLMYTYPLSEIVCVLPTFTTSYYTIKELDNYVEVIKEACDFFGIKWIDVRVSNINIFNKTTYLVDGIHPNADGMRLLCDKIYKQLIYM